MSKSSVELNKILEYITKHTYDRYHGFGPTEWAMDTVTFMKFLADECGMTDIQMGQEFDRVRAKVHGKMGQSYE